MIINSWIEPHQILPQNTFLKDTINDPRTSGSILSQLHHLLETP